jgi:hypothetical protein
MPSSSEKQRKFFGLVRAVQKGKVSPSKVGSGVSKVAKSISAKDAGDFAKSVAELKVKKAVLSILKDCREPMYLEEGESDVVTKEFYVEGKYEEYVKRYLGERFSEKELEAVNTFQDAKPTKIESNQLRYETTDAFKNSTTTIIKKLREGADFVYVAFIKTSKVEKPGQEDKSAEEQPGGLGGPSSMFEVKKKEPQIYLNYPEPSKPFLMEQGPMDPLGAPAGGVPPMAPTSPMPPAPSPTTTAPMAGTVKSPDARKKELGIDDIEIKKSTTFKDDIKGGAILAEFLKKLNL